MAEPRNKTIKPKFFKLPNEIRYAVDDNINAELDQMISLQLEDELDLKMQNQWDMYVGDSLMERNDKENSKFDEPRRSRRRTVEDNSTQELTQETLDLALTLLS